MAATTKTCPKCGGPLTPAPGDAAKLACKPCGLRFGVRPKKGAAAPTPAGPWPPRYEFADLTDTADAPAGDPRLRMALLVGAGLVIVFVGLLLTGAVAVVVWARSGPSTPVAVAPASAPAAPVVSDPAPEPTPPAPKEIAAPVTPPNKPVPPAPPIPPLADPATPPDPKPMPEAAPVPVPMPAPDVKPAQDPIDRAIDKAVVYLKLLVQQKGRGTPDFGFDRMGLIGLALLESGVAADDPAVVACANAVRTAGGTYGSNTYEMAISLWFLDRLGDPKDEDVIHNLGARLVAGQLEYGLWNYNCPTGFTATGFRLPPGVADLSQDQLKELMETLDKYDPSKEIPEKMRLAPVCRYVRGMKFDKNQLTQPAPGRSPREGGDLSNTQFAVLGLWVARKHHVPVDRSLLLIEARVRSWQVADGGWAYVPSRRGSSYSMTCSGLMELAVARAVSQPPGGKTDAADPQFEKGLQCLAELFDCGVLPGANKPAPTAAQARNLAAAAGKLRVLQAEATNSFTQNDPGGWKSSLKRFHYELERDLALDLPADAKKDLQAVDDQIKKYQAAPSEKEKKAVEDQIQKTGLGQGNGLAVSGRFLKQGKSNRYNMDDIYCLWSLERLCMVCDLKTVAGHDWYAWGADLLVADQNEDGSWPNAGQNVPLADTCMAVLFLKRANVAKDLTAQLKLVAPIMDLSADKLKYISPGETPSPGLTQPKSPGESPPSASPKP